MRIDGIFKKLLELESGVSKKGKEWKKQSFILETEAQFNPEVCITAFGKDIELIKNIDEGLKVECQVNVYSTSFNGKWYNNINIWQIDIAKEVSQADEVESEYPF